MYRQKSGVLAVEYKSRKGRVYESDIVQAKTAAPAARGNGHKVVKILIKTSTEERYITLPKRNRQLFNEVKEFIVIARQAKKGVRQNPTPCKFKCRPCPYSLPIQCLQYCAYCSGKPTDVGCLE